MNTTPWSSIPSKLTAEGFSVRYDRVSYEPGRPLWRATACRGGRQWSTCGKDLPTALEELEKQTLGIATDWRRVIAHEKAKTDQLFQHAA